MRSANQKLLLLKFRWINSFILTVTFLNCRVCQAIHYSINLNKIIIWLTNIIIRVLICGGRLGFLFSPVSAAGATAKIFKYLYTRPSHHLRDLQTYLLLQCGVNTSHSCSQFVFQLLSVKAHHVAQAALHHSFHKQE